MGVFAVTGRSVDARRAAAFAGALALVLVLVGMSRDESDRPLHSFRPVIAQLPLAFEPNRGQAGEQVDFVARGADYAVALAWGEATVVLDHARVRLELVGSRPAAPLATTRLPGTVNYLVGDRSRWRTGIPTYGT